MLGIVGKKQTGSLTIATAITIQIYLPTGTVPDNVKSLKRWKQVKTIGLDDNWIACG